jgi:MarR family transcriptional regulator for hemolysin
MSECEIDINRNNLLYHLGRLTRHWRQVLDSEFQSSGLTDATWRPLLHLQILGDGVHQKDLAASIGIEGPSLVRLLDTLVTKGLILRSEDVTDRRAKKLYLTTEGELLVAQIRETVANLENEILGPFGDTEIAQLGQFILDLEATVKKARKRVKQ